MLLNQAVSTLYLAHCSRVLLLLLLLNVSVSVAAPTSESVYNSFLLCLTIITPLHESHVQGVVVCAKSIGIQLKIRSSGHDFEGISYVSNQPFIFLDMSQFRNITVDIQNEVAVVQAGVIVGEVYYRISEKSKVHGFLAGVCPTVGVGGHLSGGYSNMIRKHGLSVDNIDDAIIVDVNGRTLSKEAMGEDLFFGPLEVGAV